MALRAIVENGGGLVITCDYGISSLEEAKEARLLGLDLIVTDHHRPGEKLPDCEAVINPKIEGSKRHTIKVE